MAQLNCFTNIFTNSLFKLIYFSPRSLKLCILHEIGNTDAYYAASKGLNSCKFI